MWLRSSLTFGLSLPQEVCSPVAALWRSAPSSPTSLTRQYNHLQSPAWPTSFIQSLLQLQPLRFWRQSYYSVKNLRVKTLIQVHTVNFHSLRWNSLVGLIPSLFLRCKGEKYIATFRKIAGDGRFSLSLISNMFILHFKSDLMCLLIAVSMLRVLYHGSEKSSVFTSKLHFEMLAVLLVGPIFIRCQVLRI